MPRVAALSACFLSLCLSLAGCNSLVSGAGFSGAKIDGGWLVCERLAVGLSVHCEAVHARSVKGFEVEIFHRGGVMTSLRESLPAEFVGMLDSVKEPPKGDPPGFQFPEGWRQLYDKVEFGWSYVDLKVDFGTPFSGRPVFDMHSGRQITEYYWHCPGGGVLTVRSNGDYVIEKSVRPSL